MTTIETTIQHSNSRCVIHCLSILVGTYVGRVSHFNDSVSVTSDNHVIALRVVDWLLAQRHVCVVRSANHYLNDVMRWKEPREVVLDGSSGVGRSNRVVAL